MMKPLAVLCVMVVLCLSHVFAQDSKLPSLKLESVSADWRIMSQGVYQLDRDEIVTLAKDPSLLTPIDLSTYNQGMYSFSVNTPDVQFQSPYGYINSQGVLSQSRFDLNVSFKILNHKTNEYRKKSVLSFGLFYQPIWYHQSNYIRTDTVSIDSFLYNYVYYDEWSRMLGVNAAWLFQSDPDKWFSTYTGIGLSLGGSINAHFGETFGAMSNYTDSAGSTPDPDYNFGIVSHTQNKYDGKNSMIVEGKIPFGINLRLYQGLSFFIEGDAMLSKQIYFNEGLSFPVNFSFVAAVGLKLRF